MNTKKISEWLEELPEPHRTKALDNFMRGGVEDLEEISLLQTLLGAFMWSSSPEGLDYWADVNGDLA